MRAEFTRAKTQATALLLRQRSLRLPVDPLRLQYGQIVRFESIQRFCHLTRTTLEELSAGTGALRDGCTVLYQNGGRRETLVLYNDRTHPPRRRFTLAHEIGHIYLGHEVDADRQEQEANAFASQLLMPAVLVRRYAEETGPLADARELAGLFGVSQAMAELRLRSVAAAGGLVPGEDRLLHRYYFLLPVRQYPSVGY